MKSIEKQMKKGRIGIALFLTLFILSAISGIYLYGQMYSYSSILFTNNLGTYVFILFFIVILMVVAFIHELNHWLSAYSFKIKNKVLGFSFLFYFVSPVFTNNKGYKKALVVFAGPLFTIFETFIFVAVIILISHLFISSIAFHYFAIKYYPILFDFIFISVVINLVNLVPLIKGTDGWAGLYILLKSKNKLNAIVICFSILSFIYFYLSLPLNLAIFEIISFIVIIIGLDKYGSKIFGFKISSIPGWHPIKILKYTVGYYYKWR